ncbi:MAG: inositol monophosphatase [Candidatus Marinimicrobia bacterium]|nr:inositol monophosphatase [Candidatus Neomarinimicrobiota bacterium]
MANLKENEILDIYHHAINISRKAGDYIARNASESLDIDYKGRANMVTQVDKKSEEILQEEITSRFPHHKILGEEFTDKDTDSELKWIIDPIDGTTNFVHGYPVVAVSIGIEYDNEIIIGVVNNPLLNEIFTAIKGHGSYYNGKRIEVSKVKKLEEALLATGFPYKLNDHFYKNMELFKKFYENSQGVRRAGSAAIDLCYVACGRLDGFWEYDLNPWDVSAGSLIVKEAGGRLSSFSSEKFSPYADEILATNKFLMEPMQKLIQENL